MEVVFGNQRQFSKFQEPALNPKHNVSFRGSDKLVSHTIIHTACRHTCRYLYSLQTYLDHKLHHSHCHSLFKQCYGCTCINDCYHSIATVGQITFIVIVTELKLLIFIYQTQDAWKVFNNIISLTRYDLRESSEETKSQVKKSQVL